MAKSSARDIDVRRSAEAERRRARLDGFGSETVVHRHSQPM